MLFRLKTEYFANLRGLLRRGSIISACDHQLRRQRPFIRITYPGEMLDLTRSSLLVQPFRIPTLTNFQRRVDKNLDKITVKDLTAALTRLHTKKPSCKNAWEIRRRSFTPEAGAASHTVPPPEQANTQPHPSATHPPPLPWMEIANRYTVGLQTPKDFGSHYKNIVHRSMWTNPHNPTARSPNCRLCKQTRETITHFGECPRLMPIFKALRLLDDSPRWDDKTLNLLGVLPSGKVLPRGISMIHFIFWKFTLIAITKLGLDGTPIDEDEIIRSARERIHTRIKSAKMQLHLTRLEAQSRRREPNFNKMKNSLSGLGRISERRGRIRTQRHFYALLRNHL